MGVEIEELVNHYDVKKTVAGMNGEWYKRADAAELHRSPNGVAYPA